MRSEPISETAATAVFADLRRQLCEVVKDGIRRRVEHLVLIEGFDPQRFVFDQESIHSSCSIVGYVQIFAHSYFCGSNGLRLWQNTAFARCRWFIGACVEGHFPLPIWQFFPYGEVAAGDDDWLTIFVLRVAFVMSPGEAHIVGRPHLCALRRPCELVGLWVPLGLCCDRGTAKDGRFAIVQGDGVIGKPGPEGFASTGRDGLRKARFQLDQKKSTLAKRWLSERAQNGAGRLRKSIIPRHGCGDVGTGLCGYLGNKRTGSDSAEKQAKRSVASHVKYATSAGIGPAR